MKHNNTNYCNEYCASNREYKFISETLKLFTICINSLRGAMTNYLGMMSSLQDQRRNGAISKAKCPFILIEVSSQKPYVQQLMNIHCVMHVEKENHIHGYVIKYHIPVYFSDICTINNIICYVQMNQGKHCKQCDCAQISFCSMKIIPC